MFIVNGKGSLIRFIAGILIVLSIVLSLTLSQNWLYFTGLIGIMLMISSLTGFCPMEYILKALGVKERTIQRD